MYLQGMYNAVHLLSQRSVELRYIYIYFMISTVTKIMSVFILLEILIPYSQCVNITQNALSLERELFYL